MVITITDSNFDQEVLKESSMPVLLDFWAEWCGPCKMIAPVVEEISNEFNGRVKVGKVDVDSNQQISQQFGIFSIPTLIIFKNGVPVERIVGYQPKKMLIEKLNQYL